tara:strand:+ start:1920 stop:2102 length:183 start_codon:yes stop_codon:yes gene_type:complete
MKEKILFTLYSLIFGILNSQDIKPEDTEVWEPEPDIFTNNTVNENYITNKYHNGHNLPLY